MKTPFTNESLKSMKLKKELKKWKNNTFSIKELFMKNQGFLKINNFVYKLINRVENKAKQRHKL